MRISDWSSDVCSSDLEGWFAAYLAWLTTSRFGTEERDEENNHGSCWLLQAASFAALLGRGDILADARTRLKTSIIPTQNAPDGRQPLELARTKPYAYARSEAHTSELKSLMRISYAVIGVKKKK